jgi:hypothetical protein
LQRQKTCSHRFLAIYNILFGIPRVRTCHAKGELVTNDICDFITLHALSSAWRKFEQAEVFVSLSPSRNATRLEATIFWRFIIFYSVPWACELVTNGGFFCFPTYPTVTLPLYGRLWCTPILLVHLYSNHSLKTFFNPHGPSSFLTPSAKSSKSTLIGKMQIAPNF